METKSLFGNQRLNIYYWNFNFNLFCPWDHYPTNIDKGVLVFRSIRKLLIDTNKYLESKFCWWNLFSIEPNFLSLSLAHIAQIQVDKVQPYYWKLCPAQLGILLSFSRIINENEIGTYQLSRGSTNFELPKQWRRWKTKKMAWRETPRRQNRLVMAFYWKMPVPRALNKLDILWTVLRNTQIIDNADYTCTYTILILLIWVWYDFAYHMPRQ